MRGTGQVNNILTWEEKTFVNGSPERTAAAAPKFPLMFCFHEVLLRRLSSFSQFDHNTVPPLLETSLNLCSMLMSCVETHFLSEANFTERLLIEDVKHLKCVSPLIKLNRG